MALLLPQAVSQARDEGLVCRAGHVTGQDGQVGAPVCQHGQLRRARLCFIQWHRICHVSLRNTARIVREL